jgi:hypothetical protein
MHTYLYTHAHTLLRQTGEHGLHTISIVELGDLLEYAACLYLLLRVHHISKRCAALRLAVVPRRDGVPRTLAVHNLH